MDNINTPPRCIMNSFEQNIHSVLATNNSQNYENIHSNSLLMQYNNHYELNGKQKKAVATVSE
jgi:hypothetical protein